MIQLEFFQLYYRLYGPGAIGPTPFPSKFGPIKNYTLYPL